MSGRRAWPVAALLLLPISAAPAADPLPAAPYADVQLADPAREAAAKALMEQLRCLVCQSQSITDSNAELAGDMRSLVRQRIAAGESPAAVRTWLIRRYGAWISYDPPIDRTTWPLWVLPLAALAAGCGLATVSFRRRR